MSQCCFPLLYMNNYWKGEGFLAKMDERTSYKVIPPTLIPTGYATDNDTASGVTKAFSLGGCGSQFAD